MQAMEENTTQNRTTSYKVVIPFYTYAAISFGVATLLLLLNAGDFMNHYFQPHVLAITHIMTLGWGTMMILGASHQLVPVLVEQPLYSNTLGLLSFILAATGIPLLAYGFYAFDMGWPAQWGGMLIILSFACYLVNLGISISGSKNENVHAYFVFTAMIWLMATAVVGLLLVFNFTRPLLPKDSLAYLSLHAHLGIVGWFLLLITGVGSRLIPMFLISKYQNTPVLWWIYGLVNVGLLLFILLFIFSRHTQLFIVPLFCVTGAIVLFGKYCYQSYLERIRRKVDPQMRISILSVFMMLLPLVFLLLTIILGLLSDNTPRVMMAYGFIILFGWITAIIFGMTFKTLPFIVWNKLYHHLAGKQKTPNPVDLFSNKLFVRMCLLYLLGVILFFAGIILHEPTMLRFGGISLVLSSFLYNWNVFTLLLHKPGKT